MTRVVGWIHAPILLGVGATLLVAATAAMLWAEQFRMAAAMTVLVAANLLGWTSLGLYWILDGIQGVGHA